MGAGVYTNGIHVHGSDVSVAASGTVVIASGLAVGWTNYFGEYQVSSDQTFLAWVEINGTVGYQCLGAANTPAHFFTMYPAGVGNNPTTFVLKVTNTSNSTSKVYGTLVYFKQ